MSGPLASDGTTVRDDGRRQSAPLLRVTNVAKAFGRRRPFATPRSSCVPGVHALVGENGCGKSTVVKILSGVHAPDAGEIELHGQIVTSISTPSEAQEPGIFTVFQEVLVAESRSVLDNVWLGVDDTWPAPGVRARSGPRAQSSTSCSAEHRSWRPLSRSSAQERQASSRARSCATPVLILDEATSALDVATRDRPSRSWATCARRGVGVIFITHRMDEIEQIGDRITVMRSG